MALHESATSAKNDFWFYLYVLVYGAVNQIEIYW